MMHKRYIFLLVVMASNPDHAELSEGDFTNINNAILNIYRPLLSQKNDIEMKELYRNFGGAFKVDSTLKIPSQNRIIITLTGQVAKSHAMNTEGYAIVACHEIGHILGGEPRQKSSFSSWSSVEGQADYFATNQCMWSFVKASPGLVKEKESLCLKHFFSPEKIADCSRIIAGIKAMAGYLNTTRPISEQIGINQKDLSEVLQTLQKYPSAQCRVDTWLAGLFNQPRPHCWFAS